MAVGKDIGEYMMEFALDTVYPSFEAFASVVAVAGLHLTHVKYDGHRY